MQRLFICILPLFIVASTCKAQTNRYYNNFQDSTIHAQWMNGNTIVKDNDSLTNFFSRTDKEHPYSSGIEMKLPENIRSKNFRLSIKGRIRATVTDAKNQLVISFAQNDSLVFWTGIELPDSSGVPGQWTAFGYTNLFPRNIPPGCTFKVFIWNADGLSVTDVDDMEITFTETPFTSFLPK